MWSFTLLVVLSCFISATSFAVPSARTALPSLPLHKLGQLTHPTSAYSFHAKGLRMSTLEPEADETGTIINTGVGGQLKRGSKIMYRFSRPHTIKGTILASVMSVLRAIRENPSALTQQSLGPLFARAVTGLFALLCGNAYIVGINQIYDVKIDEINKPFLPIAAKQLSEQRAWHVVLGCLAMGMVIVKKCFSPLIANLYVLGAVLGTIYSVPPLQFKRFPVLAGGIIAIVRGFLLNFGVYCAVREALQVPLTWNPVVGFISTFMTVFATVIAITKDLPDVEGDIRYNIGTFASKYGVKRVAGLATGVLSMAYVAAVALPFLPATSTAFNTAPMVGGHLLGLAYNLGIFRDFAASSGRITDAKAYYRKVWNMFYFEYLLYLLI